MFSYDVADFTEYPIARHKNDGPCSGEEFRGMIINFLDKHGRIKLILDNTFGYGSSFLEEVFGGLVRQGYKKKYIKDHIVMDTASESLKMEIEEYLNDAINEEEKVV